MSTVSSQNKQRSPARRGGIAPPPPVEPKNSVEAEQGADETDAFPPQLIAEELEGGAEGSGPSSKIEAKVIYGENSNSGTVKRSKIVDESVIDAVGDGDVGGEEYIKQSIVAPETEDGLTYTVIEVLEVPQGITPEQISVYIDEDDELVVQAEYPGVVELSGTEDVYGDFEVSESVKEAINRAMSFAKLNPDKDPIFRRAIAELLTTSTSVSHTWRKYKINHITLTKYYRMANEFLKGESPTLKKGKRQRSEVGGSSFRRVLQIPPDVLKETVKCYFEPWDGRLTITAAVASNGHGRVRSSNALNLGEGVITE